MKLRLTIIFACVFLILSGYNYLLPNWTFTNGYLHITYKLLTQFSFLALILCIVLLLKINRKIVWGLGAIFIVFFILSSLGEIFPIDTTTEPNDIMVLRTDPNGQKLIVREYKNVKTNELIHDTIIVKDKFIFRKKIKG